MPGWTNKILEIDLEKKKFSVIELPSVVYQKFYGGKGLAGYFLKPFIHLSWDDPKMPLLFFTGPLTGTPSPTSGRLCVSSRSPLTGAVGDTSAGGKMAGEIKKAGWDGIILRGRSDKLCGLQISGSEISFSNAVSLTGKSIPEILKLVPRGGSNAIVGPAAENGVLFSSICIDGHYFAGRTGLGLVMYTKNLKFIHVDGHENTPVYDKDEILRAREDIFRLVASSPVLLGEMGISEYGTGTLYDLMHTRRMMPTDNFRSTQFENAPELNAAHYKNKFGTKKSGCAACHIQCKKIAGDGRIIPEFETMSHFTALLGNTDSETVMEANRICNETGMDTISAAATLSCYAEINKKKLRPEDILSLLRNIACSASEGNDLKLGSSRYAELMGMPETSISVKGLELPGYDPRGAYGMALAYATSTRGACHLRAYPIAHEILRKPVATDRFSFSGKARIIKLNEDMNAMVDSLIACKFIFLAASLEEYARMFSAVTGIETSGLELLKAGERIYYNDRIMNSINGFDASDDDLPARFFTTDGSSGDGIKVKAIDRSEFLQARANYYIIRGLDQNGLPTEEKCKELGLEWKS